MHLQDDLKKLYGHMNLYNACDYVTVSVCLRGQVEGSAAPNAGDNVWNLVFIPITFG